MLGTFKKINFLITKIQKKRLIVLIILLFIGMVMEVFGLGILIPTLSIILDPEKIEKTPFIYSIRTYFSEFSDQIFVFLFLGSIVLIYFLKSIFVIFLTYKQNRFLNNITSSISNNLFASYLSKPYDFHLRRNSSELIKNIQIEMNYFYAFLLALINIFVESGFVFSVLITLIYIEPFGAICIGVFYGLLSLIFFQFTKRKLKQWGELRKELDVKISKLTLEGLGGIKELLVFGKVNFFINEYTKKNFSRARLNANHGTVSQIPRFYLEFISITGLVTFIIILLATGSDTLSLITVLGVFVAGTFRMIPSLNRIIASSQSIKYYRPSLEIIFNEIYSNKQIIISDKPNNDFNFKNQIKFDNVNFSFSPGIPILTNINIEISKGQTIGIIGESGTGKSTFVDLLIGLHKPTKGNIYIDGIKDFQFNQSWRKKIGYVSQSIYLLDDSIKNNIAFGFLEKEIDFVRINKIIKNVQLEDFINTLELGVDTKVGERGIQLSGGQRQRIAIARALYNDPELLIFDEATAALDTQTENDIINAIYELKGEKTIVMIAHRLSTLNRCDQIYEIKKGNLNNIEKSILKNQILK